ncbi:GNAT family N-acetyltransferase [Kitasatospora sp. NPDC054939]
MKIDSRLEQANRNAAAFWQAQADAHHWQQVVRPGWTAVRCARTPVDAHRILVTEPYDEPVALEEELGALLRDWSSEKFTVEDPYGRLDLSRFGGTCQNSMAVMAREPGPVVPHGREVRSAGAGLTDGPVAVAQVGALAGGGGFVGGSGSADGGGAADGGTAGAAFEGPTVLEEVFDDEVFAEVERTIVDGFPLEARQPWVRGVALPAPLLHDPGCRAWLARRNGEPAGACLAYDDGSTVGLYWVATLPEHRSRGVARAVVEAALAAHPDRPATLVATKLGAPLYLKMGFTEQSRTFWWNG